MCPTNEIELKNGVMIMFQHSIELQVRKGISFKENIYSAGSQLFDTLGSRGVRISKMF